MLKMLKLKKVKEKFNMKGIRAGKAVIKEFIKIEEQKINKDIDKILRESRISGRKNLRKENLGVIE